MRGSDWRYLANTIGLSVCGGDAALCQITLTTSILGVLYRTIMWADAQRDGRPAEYRWRKRGAKVP